jgi:hypothetical protein
MEEHVRLGGHDSSSGDLISVVREVVLVISLDVNALREFEVVGSIDSVFLELTNSAEGRFVGAGLLHEGSGDGGVLAEVAVAKFHVFADWTTSGDTGGGKCHGYGEKGEVHDFLLVDLMNKRVSVDGLTN